MTSYQAQSLSAALLWGLATAAIILALVLLHELAHLVAARSLGVTPYQVRLFIFGGVRAGAPRGAPRELFIAAAGILASGLAGAALIRGSGQVGGVAGVMLELGGWMSIGLAGINLLPVMPLDGGLALRAARLRMGHSHARRTARRTGLVLGAGGLGLLTYDPWAVPWSALGLWLALAGVFILSEGPRAIGEAEAAVRERRKPSGAIGAWAIPFAGRVDADDEVPAPTGRPFAVSEDGRLAGILPPHTPGSAIRMGTVREQMIPWSPQLGVDQQSPAPQALRRLARREVPVLVVLDERGVVRGVVDEATVRMRLQDAT